MFKRLFDIVVAVVGLIILFPILLIIALLIKVDSPGSVFYRGTRTGMNGKVFQIFKFRTMVPNADKLGGLSTAKDDPRVTKIGKVLRRHKLDELPQLFNVLKGEMSIVGPRPEMPDYTALYKGEEKLILSVRPGITDYASLEFIQLGDVLGNENPDRVYEQKVRPVKNALRIKYVKEQSFWRDITIIIRTLRELTGI
jgi:lipopolysaccharide/colanic/teichoic acid biosynthesis glycosyltransferase